MEFSIPDKKVEDERISIYVVSRSLCQMLLSCPTLLQYPMHKTFSSTKVIYIPFSPVKAILFQNLFYGRLIQFRSLNLNNIYCGNFSSNSGYIGSLWALVGSFDNRVKSPKKKNPQTLIEVREIDKGGSDSLSWQKNSRRHCKSI